MGISPHPFLVSLNSKGMIGGNEETSRARRRLKLMMKRKIVKSRRSRRVLMKRRTSLERSRSRPTSAIEGRVRTLKRLIPNGEGMGLDGLFRETADYILSLQMRVRVMQIMVKVLTGGSEE